MRRVPHTSLSENEAIETKKEGRGENIYIKSMPPGRGLGRERAKNLPRPLEGPKREWKS